MLLARNRPVAVVVLKRYPHIHALPAPYTRLPLSAEDAAPSGTALSITNTIRRRRMTSSSTGCGLYWRDWAIRKIVCRIIHVAGTKGKGSTSAMLAAVLPSRLSHRPVHVSPPMPR